MVSNSDSDPDSDFDPESNSVPARVPVHNISMSEEIAKQVGHQQNSFRHLFSWQIIISSSILREKSNRKFETNIDR